MITGRPGDDGSLLALAKQLAGGPTKMICINYLEMLVKKVPKAMTYLSQATGPTAGFEKPAPRADASRWRKRLQAASRSCKPSSQGSRGLRASVIQPGRDRHANCG
jgi:hypothetical protein